MDSLTAVVFAWVVFGLGFLVGAWFFFENKELADARAKTIERLRSKLIISEKTNIALNELLRMYNNSLSKNEVDSK